MAKIKLQIDKKTIKATHPLNWDEVTSRDFVSIAKYINGDIQDPVRRIVLFLDLLELSKKQRRNLPEGDDQLTDAMLTMGQFLSETPPDKWFIPFVRIGLKKYYSPRPTLSGTTFNEFLYIDTYFQQFHEDQSGEHLWRMASILYRPKGQKADDVRIPFNEAKHNLFSEKWKRVNGYIIEAIYFNYRIVRNHIEDLYPALFPKNEEEKPEDDMKLAPIDPVWLTSLEAICDGDLDKMNKYGADEMHNVLRLMDRSLTKKRKK